MTTHFGLLDGICRLSDFQSKRSSSWDRTGGNGDCICIEPGKRAELLKESGAGCVKHFYWTYICPSKQTRQDLFRGLVLRAFWDGAKTPSIEVPIGDFFGVTNGQLRPIKSLAFTANPGHDNPTTWGFNCYLPMPFARGARIEVENQGNTPVVIWFHVDYELYADASAIPEDIGRLHAIWRRENPTKATAIPAGQSWTDLKNLSGDDNYVILDVQGSGQFVGYFLTVVNIDHGWYGEGDDMVFIDGEDFPPSIHGTGTEEIFGGGAGPSVEFTGPYTGFHCVENRMGDPYWGDNGMYRFYLTDPLRFQKSIRVTVEHGHGNDKANDYSSVVFWYQKGVNPNLPALPDYKARAFRHEFAAPLLPEPKPGPRVGPFIQEWLVLGPFENTVKSLEEVNAGKKTAVDTVYPPEKDLDSLADKAGIVKTYQGKNGRQVAWTKVNPQYVNPVYVHSKGYINLLELFPEEWAVCFLLTRVYSKKDRNAILWLGSDDGCKIWVNEKEVFRFVGDRGAWHDQNAANIHLKQGWNTLVLKVEQFIGDWGVFVRIEELMDEPEDLSVRI